MSKTLLVTGGRGLGGGIARHLSRHGLVDNVLIASKRLSSAQRAAQEVEGGGSARAVGVECDVGDSASVDSAFDACKAHFGEAPTFVVHAAGVSYDALLVRSRDEEIQDTLTTNLLGSVLVCRKAIKDMLRTRVDGGSILLIGSVVGRSGHVGQSVYSASKSGLVGLTKSIAQEVGRKNIRVNLLEPGYIRTDMTKHLDESSLCANIPLGRFGEVAEIARAAEFMLLDATYMTGSVLTMDGGVG